MNYTPLKLCIATLLLLCLAPHISNAQKSRKDTTDAFLFDFITMQQTSPAYLNIVLQKATKQLNDKNTGSDNQAKFLIIAADANIKLRRVENSYECIQKAEIIANKQNNKQLQAIIALEKGNLYRIVSEKEKARDSYQKAIATARSADDLFIEAESYIQLGNISKAEGNAKQALTAYEQAINIYRKKNSQELLIKGLTNRSAAFRDLSNKEAALKDINEALAIATEINSPSISITINIKGSIYYRFGEVDLALQSYRAAQYHIRKQPFKEEQQATLLENIALCLKDKLQYTEM